MKIYFFSDLNGSKYAGPSYSVPRTIEEISKSNDVFWINMCPCYDTDVSTEGNFTYIGYTEYKEKGFERILEEHGKPDIVVFEEVLCLKYCYAGYVLRKTGIPYIIVPRGCLCTDAQSQKKLKKKIANIVFFNRFIKHAAAIQYLTTKELNDSGVKWNKNYFVIPNGTDIRNFKKDYQIHYPLIGVFIGRLDIFHKGIDLLIETLSKNRPLIEGKIVIKMYGADSVGDGQKIKNLIDENELDKIVQLNGPVYDSEKEIVLKNADFFVLTSRFEGHPMGLLEALSYRLPALVTYGSNMGEEIKNSCAGFVGETSATGIETALFELIDSIPRFETYQENAYNLAKQYSWESICENIINALGKTIKGQV